MLVFLTSLFVFGTYKIIFAQFHQSDYLITYERMEILNYDRNYMDNLKAHNFKYNRTHFATNLTGNFLTDFGYKMQVEVQAYKFISNEYRQFPIRFGFNFCAAAAKNDFGMQNLYRCGNFSRCPMKKGLHIICNLRPDQSHFPPFIPEGSYMLEIRYFYLSIEVQSVQAYGTVKIPMKIPLY